MSTGKRLAKRSILGTRVVAPGLDGRLYPAIIQAVKTYEDRVSENRYSVRFDNSRKVVEFHEHQIIGSGFSGLVNLPQLRAGQKVYITHQGREMEGHVMEHKTGQDSLLVKLMIGTELEVRLEDIRLLESRKSSRLMGHPTNFQKLADYNIVQERKRLNSEKSNISSDGSESTYSSRKRRGSETLSEEGSSGDESYRVAHTRRANSRNRRRGEEQSPRRRRGEEARQDHMGHMGHLGHMGHIPGQPIMSECTAAMVLMDLSGMQAGRVSHASGQSDGSLGRMSPSSSGVSSLGTSWTCSSPCPSLTPPFPSFTPPFPLPPTERDMEEGDPVEALLQLSGNNREERSDTDEGIVSDQSNEFDREDSNKRLKTEHVRTIYQCTWPGCDQQEELCQTMEHHVRKAHLGREDPSGPEEDDREEEFYYTEIDIPMSVTVHCEDGGDQMEQDEPGQLMMAYPQPPTPTVTPTPAPFDHMDMARPPHENPEYGGPPLLTPATSPCPNYATMVPPGMVPLSHHQALHAVPIAIPITTFTFSTNATLNQSSGKYIRLSPKPYGSSPKSPIRRPRGDAKKCRKVYGMEHRELWCTQCKWKKACTRFGEGV